MKQYRGGYQICRAIGKPSEDYIKVVNFLNLIKAPMEINERGVNTYCLNEEQIKFLKNELKKIKEYLK